MTETKPHLVCANDVPYEEPRFLIAPYFQRGKGTLIQGDNGSGKTAFMCGVVAAISSGQRLLGIPVQTPGNVLILSVEDDLPILRGRIEASGGNLTHCFFLTNAAGLTFSSPIIEKAIAEIDARLILFDPIQAFFGSSLDMNRANQTRPALAKLFEMCERHDCAAAIIAHTSKSSTDKAAVNRSLGSVDVPAAMRSILQLAKNPSDPTECVMIHVKCSNAPRGKAIAYTIGERGGVHWTGFSNLTIEDLNVQKKREQRGVDYEHEPLVQVFNQLIADNPNKGFWSYAELKSKGAKILGFPPFSDLSDLRSKLDCGLARELQKRDGLIISHSERSHGNQRGIRIERYAIPRGFQMHMGRDG